jgi:hypothetical protein
MAAVGQARSSRMMTQRIQRQMIHGGIPVMLLLLVLQVRQQLLLLPQ